jgi:glycosyltransferase involved in cell wall biosynthesis
MKALLISGIYPPEIGGPATYIPKLASRLTELGVEVEVVTLKNSGSAKLSEPWNMNYIIRDQNIFKRIVKTSLSIRAHAKKSNYIFSNGLYTETAFGLFMLRKKSIAKIVGDPVFERASNKGKTTLSRGDFNKSKLPFVLKIQSAILRWSLNQFSAVTCPSLELQALIGNWGIDKPIVLIPNGVAAVEHVDVNKEFDVITVSRLIQLKNIDKLIIACASTKSKLAIVGSGPEEFYLKNLALQLNAPVEFLGQLNEDDVTKMLCKSRIFALLSDYEGLSFALLQSMACGVPAVVSNVNGNTDVITDKQEGLIVNVNNQTEIEGAIKELLKSPDLLIQYGSAAKLKSKNIYDLVGQIDRVIDLMKLSFNE